MSFLIGCDPEVFVGDANGVRSIIGLIGGTKNNPLPMPMGEGFAVQEDNVALEFNIPPSPTKELFVANMSSAMDFLSSIMQDMHGLHFVKDSALSFPVEQLQDPRALSFGCDPDYNAWTGNINPRPRSADKTLRSCGGHVHIGTVTTKYAWCNPQEIIKAMDLFTGVPSVYMDKGLLRKQLYGKAGAYRPKDYGVEYRSLSNYWIFSKELQEWVYENTERALDAVLNEVSFDEDASLIQLAINKSNTKAADYLREKYSLNVL